MNKPEFTHILEHGQTFVLQESLNDVAIYAAKHDDNHIIAYRGSVLDEVVQDSVSLDKLSAEYAAICKALPTMGFRLLNGSLPIGTRHSNGWWLFDVEDTLRNVKKSAGKKAKPAVVEAVEPDEARNENFALPAGEIKPNIGDLHTLTSDLVRSTNKQTVSRLRAAELDHPDRLIAWSEDNREERCIEKLKTKLARNEPYDAINYLMFAAYHGWDVSPVSSLTPAKHPCQVFSGARMSEEDAEKVRKAVAEMRNTPHLFPSATMTMDPADDITMVYEFKDAKQRDDYSGLYSVLMDALDQACNGKGRERHANDKPFEEQPMQTFSDALGSPQGLGFQVMKKTAEAMGMDEPERQIRELLGAINYAAGMIIWINRNNQ